MRCAVLGDPIAHSLSPVLHRAGYAAVGLDWEYDAVRVRSGGLAGFLTAADASLRGLSLTMPLKREALPLVSGLSDRGRLAGAVNTLVRDQTGWVGENTDIPGAVAAIRERYDADLDSATILGGGATATSVGLALCELGVATIRLLVRSPVRAAETVAALSAHPRAPAVTVGSLDSGEVSGDIVVSTIPAAAQTPPLVARCSGVPVVFEVIYHPWPTLLAESAAGRTLVSGLDLLVHQAALQFELFTGQSVPLAAMRAAAGL